MKSKLERPRVLLVAATTGYQSRAFVDAATSVGVSVSLATDRCHILDDPWGDHAYALRFEDPEGSAETLAATGARYLAALQLSADAPADLRLDAAKAYRRLAAIQGYPGTSNIGEPDQARASLGRAQALLAALVADQPDNAAAHAGLGWVHADRWASVAGDGPSQAQIDAVFGSFVRLEQSRNRQTGGLGLGLTIARNIARAAGGEISLSNNPGGGLLTQLRLPLAA